MSKTDTDLLDINREKCGGTLNTPKFTTDLQRGRTINVFDYETADGMPFMLAYKYDGEAARVETNPVDTPDGERMGPLPTAQALKLLHNGKTRDGALNFWYNLNFDANIFLKDLPEAALNRLRATNSVEVEVAGKELQLTYLPKKMLEIRSNKKVSRHYDISQFTYSGSLESAVEDWLDGVDGKATPTVAPSSDAWDESLRRKTGDGVAYVDGAIERHSDEVIEYAKRDAVLTEKVAQAVVSTAEDDVQPPIPFGRPYSTGYVAADYVRAHADAKPQFRTVSFQRAALKAYAGGRFEVYERGRIEDAVAGPDINSAYPWVMDSLPSLAQLRVGHIGKFDGDAIDVVRRTYGDDYYDLRGYAFVKVRATTDDSRRIQPFAVKTDGLVQYPALDNSEVWTIGPILAHAIDAGYVEDYEIIDGFAALPPEGDDPERLFAEKGVDIGGLYAKRKALEAAGNDRRAKLIKIVLNSLYGKTCQINPKRRFLSDVLEDEDVDLEPPEDGDVDDYLDALAVTDDDLPNEAQRTGQVVDGEHLVEEYEAGNFFNPAVAAYTTGMTRLKLHESVVSHGLEDDTLMLATDCMLVRADAFDATPLADEADSDPDKTDSAAMRDALGGWDYDYRGEGGALLVASGVYEVYDLFGDGDTYTKARGFDKLLSDDYPTLRGCIQSPDEYLSDDRTAIVVENMRPRTFGEVVFQGKSLRQVGEFFSDDRELSASMDRKRSWKRDPTMTDLLDSSEVGDVKTVTDRTVDDSA